ncbi:NAD(P)/FAD-dependent oxidoreductase [Mycobacterium sp. GA-2829]|uniref:flavin-containing monooxygenase n=1 Tax=Mycobacterium sp. GA-2829 TaxID=1772283 RepID=UPI0007402093|nr:NAD(P)/FAD-dependent oxidoreductase [Mycobacterium sp. GA-2829]KUI29214.1 hypothetical protein AU194_20250 [Mycobacterium sp. GA-2829]
MSLVVPHSVGIVGAGLSGLAAAMYLRHAGCRDIAVYEKADDLGGTWRDNRYPGLYCDAPARMYCYSFAPNSTSPTLFADAKNIHRYLSDTARTFGVSDLIQYRAEVTGADWHDGAWTLTLADGSTRRHDAVVLATGYLHHPTLPTIAGMGDFAGRSFHSARWPEGLDVSGLRVGVIGAGSTGVQIVTALSESGTRVVHFQRTPQWIIPFPNLRYSRRSVELHKRVPAIARRRHSRYTKLFVPLGNAARYDGVMRKLFKLAAHHGLRTVRDRDLRKRLTPDYEILCKRTILSGGYYRAIQRPNAALITDRIERIVNRGIITGDGVLHELDVIVYATGFDAHAYMRPMNVRGIDGESLDEAWSNGARAHRSVMVPGFPNLFLTTGPYSPLANSSIATVAEAQAAFLVRALQKATLAGARALHPTVAATDRFEARIAAAIATTVWATGDCNSWYLDGDGRIELWPFAVDEHTNELREPDLDEYELIYDSAGGFNAEIVGQHHEGDHEAKRASAARRANTAAAAEVRH